MKVCLYCKSEIHEDSRKDPCCSEWLEIRAEVVEKRVDVNQVELAELVRKEVEETLKRRYTWIGVLTIFLTGGGVLLVQASTLSVNREVIVEWRISARESQKRLERID